MTDEPMNLVHAAQEAAEARLRDGETVLLYEDNQEDITDEMYKQAADQLAGPFCGCQVCIVREVLNAAWPYLAVHAVDEYVKAMSDPEVRSTIERMAEQVKARRAAEGD